MATKTHQRIYIETYRNPKWQIQNIYDTCPSFVNKLQYRRWRITAELIDEPIEVLQERLQKMWEEDRNHHHHRIYIEEAKSLGFELQGEMGEKNRSLKHGMQKTKNR